MKKSVSVAVRLAWSFAIVFLVGMAVIAGFSYYELVIEPEIKPDEHESFVHGIAVVAVEASITVLALSLVGWWFARRAIQPVERLVEAVNQIKEGNLDEPISIPGSGAEFEQLAQVFNSMTSRLDASFQRVRQFTLYASHELKTPLAILRLEFEKLAEDPARGDADRARFATCLEEIERLADLVDSLTFLTKMDARLIALARDPVELKPLLANAAEDTTALGAERNIEVRLARCDDALITGDRQRLRQLLLILCDNAIKYNRQGGWITLSLEAADKRVNLRIANAGPGIPPDEQHNVFERFYRGSSANADGIHGMGLGLNIAQWIVNRHGGTLTFTSQPEHTEFIVRL